MKATKRLIALLLAAGVLMTGCSSSSSSDSSSDTDSTSAAEETTDTESAEETTEAEAEDEGAQEESVESAIAESITVRMPALDSLSPFGTGAYYSCLKEVCENLFELDGFGGEMIPVLADGSRGEYGGYDHEEGSTDYTVYIYDYITDSAGNSITASDVKWSYDNQNDNYVTDGWGNLEEVIVVDDTTITFRFTEEVTGLGELENVLCRCFIFSEESYNASSSQFASDLTGTGPYVITDYVPGVSVSMEARDDYWQTDEDLLQYTQLANVKTINYEMIDEETQIVLGLREGTLDIANGVSSINLTSFQEGGEYADDYSIYSYSHNSVYFLSPNCSEDSVCGDVNMRLALFYSVNLDGLVAALGSDSVDKVSALGTDLFGDYVESWADEENYNTVYDEDLAKEYLEASGYDGSDVRLLCSSSLSTTAEVLQQMWENIGISVTILAYDQATSTTVEADSTAWDIELMARGSSDYLCNLWLHYFDLSRSTMEDLTTNFINDAEWAEMLTLACSLDGHTDENMDAWWDHCVENAYAMGLYSEVNTFVYSNQIVGIVKSDKNELMPGAFTYAAE